MIPNPDLDLEAATDRLSLALERGEPCEAADVRLVLSLVRMVIEAWDMARDFEPEPASQDVRLDLVADGNDTRH